VAGKTIFKKTKKRDKEKNREERVENTIKQLYYSTRPKFKPRPDKLTRKLKSCARHYVDVDRLGNLQRVFYEFHGMENRCRKKTLFRG
jgi:hypothetical protein